MKPQLICKDDRQRTYAKKEIEKEILIYQKHIDALRKVYSEI